MKNYIVFILFFFGKNFLLSQIVEFPAFDSKTHPTLEIVSIESNLSNTVFHMKLKNELQEGGWFCVDKDVIISFNGGKEKLRMEKVSGIENCPDLHRFSDIGEVVEFDLFFPPIPKYIERIDLVENCSDNCFSFTGISLNSELNNEIKKFENALNLYRNNEIENALQFFIDIRDNSKFHLEKPFGYSSYIIPVIYYNLNRVDEAIKAYKLLQTLEIPDKDYFLNKLKEIDFFKDF